MVPEPGVGRQPSLSVVMPVRDGAHFLPASLGALFASDLPGSRWELIVVDDGSHDGSAAVAASHGATVPRPEPTPRGAGHARNRGARIARGDYLLFVDADVCVHPDVLRRVTEIFECERDVSAVFGAYDLAPAAPGLVTQYRNLLHRYVHERDAGEAVTFWAGCGAVRAEVFARTGGFDETQRTLEDVELGYRMVALGYRLVLRPEIQGRHLKRWTLGKMVKTDVWDRGVPWLRLLRRQAAPPRSTLNLRTSEKVATTLVGGAVLALAALAWTGQRRWLILAALAGAGTLATNAPMLAWFARQRGWGFALRVVPLRFLYYGLNLVSVALALVPDRSRR
jgi:glycosyltransferase involved in cell wall biosynthesis